MRAMSAVEKTAVLNRLTGTLFLALHTSYPDDSGSGEVPGTTWTNYARISFDGDAVLTAPAASGEAHFVENSSQIQGAETETTGTVSCVGFSIHDAASAGNMFYGGPLFTAVVSFVGLATDNTLYSPAHGFNTNDVVVLQGSSLPTGLSEETEYHVIGATTNSFQLAATQGGAAITISADGSGNIGISQFLDVTDAKLVTLAAQALQVLVS